MTEPAEELEAPETEDLRKELDFGEIVRAAEGQENISERIHEDDLKALGRAVVDDYEKDLDTRRDWKERMAKAMDLAMQVVETKSFPWPGASNVKFPLLSIGAMQFAARAFKNVVREPAPVQGKVNGQPTPEKVRKAIRIGQHMSYQLIEQMDGWVEDMDTLLHVLPIMGCDFKKTFFDPATGKNRSDRVGVDRLVFDYYAKNVETARRKTETFDLDPQVVIERQRLGIYREGVSFTRAPEARDTEERDRVGGTEPPPDDDDAPFFALEQHRYWDLDGDGYREPYIVTVDYGSADVLRVVPRFDASGVTMTRKGPVILPVEYYTQYTLLPDPSGGNLGIGWGHILFPMNEVVNSLYNMLVDSGTLANTQGGLISKSLKKGLPGQTISIQPGKFEEVNATFEEIAKGIYPWPFKEPSAVLFSLLALTIDWTQRLMSVTDTMAGENPPINQPATTTLAMLEQGTQVFSSIHKRIYRGLGRELKKLKRLNRLYLEPEEYFRVLDVDPLETLPPQLQVLLGGAGTGAPMPGGPPAPPAPMMPGAPSPMMMPGMRPNALILRTDYEDDGTDVEPSADPNITTERQSAAKFQGLVQAMQAGVPYNPIRVAQIGADALQISRAEQKDLIPQELPQREDPKVTVEKMRTQVEGARLQLEDKHEQMRSAMDAQKAEHKRQYDGVRSELGMMKQQLAEAKFNLDKFMAVRGSDQKDREIAQKDIETVAKAHQAFNPPKKEKKGDG